MKIKVNYCDDLKYKLLFVDNEYKWLYQQVCIINKNELDLKYDIELVDKLSKYMVDVEAKKVKKINNKIKSYIYQECEIIIHDEITDDTCISGKYKTIADIKKSSKLSGIQTIAKMKDGNIKDYLCKWAFEKYYLPNKFSGNLTTRIKKISNNPCYKHIINHYFDGINPLNTCKISNILNDDCKKYNSFII